MQAGTNRRLLPVALNRVVLTVGFLSCLVLGTMAITLVNQVVGEDNAASRSVTIPHQLAVEARQLEQNLTLEQNSWGEDFDLSALTTTYFPNADDASLMHEGIPSY